jgi:hypothetical protein
MEDANEEAEILVHALLDIMVALVECGQGYSMLSQSSVGLICVLCQFVYAVYL